MPPLQIDFEDGFDGDTVVVRADGEEVWRQDGVTTNVAISLAAIAQVEVPESAEVEVEVETQGLSATSPMETPYLEVEVIEGRLTVRSSPDLPAHL
jgi:anti-sigma factor RsiW